jgi:hypothetical protein
MAAPARIATIVTTIINSIRVKPRIRAAYLVGIVVTAPGRDEA